MKMTMKYTIRYNHTGDGKANSRVAALALVKSEAMACGRRFGYTGRLRHIQCSDGLYLYLSTEEMKRDPDGSRAFAVISETAKD